MQLTSTSNTYTGGTVVEQGSSLMLTTANVSSGNANITNAGGLVVFDQTGAAGTYTGVISDGRQMQAASGPLLSGSLVKDDSTGANSGNVILASKQAYTGGTFIEAGTLSCSARRTRSRRARASTSAGVGGPDEGTGVATGTRPVTGHAWLARRRQHPQRTLMSEAGQTIRKCCSTASR